MSGSLVLSDGSRTMEWVNGTGIGTWLESWVPPLPGVENTYAESADSEGRVRTRSTPKNSESGSVKLVTAATDQQSFHNFVDELQEIVASAHSNKGTLVYTPPRNGSPVTFYIESIQVTGLPQPGVPLHALVCEPEVSFECKPFGVQDPLVVASAVVLAGPIASFDIPNVPGHVDAWGEMTLTEGSGQSRSHVEVAVQDDYNPASPEPIRLNLASGLTVSGYAGASTTRAGSYATNVARATLTNSPVTVCATTAQPHKGKWKPRVRVYPAGIVDATGKVVAGHRVRLAWKVGDGPITPERWVSVPGGNNYYDLDLATINIGELELGHSWTGYIQAYSTIGAPTLDVDDVYMLPAPRYSKARVPGFFDTPPSIAAYDEFDTLANGNLTGQVGPGGTWTVLPTGAGSAPDGSDYQVQWGDPPKNTYKNVLRTAVSDTAPRPVTLGTTNYPAFVYRGTFAFSDGAGSYGALVRATDMANHVFFAAVTEQVQLVKVLGGTPTPIWTGGLLGGASSYDWQIAMLADGRWWVWMQPGGAPFGDPLEHDLDSQLASGVLSTGRLGLYDWHSSSVAETRLYDHISVSIPTADAALFANHTIRFTHDSILRQNATGSAEGRVRVPEGKYLTIAPGTRAGRHSRGIVKSRRLDVDDGQPCLGGSDTLTMTQLLTRGRVTLIGPPIPAGFPTYALSNITTDRTVNCNSTSLNELANALGTLVGDYPLPIPVYTFTNGTTDRVLNCNSTSLDELADLIFTVYTDLAAPGSSPSYTITNVTTTRTLNAASINIDTLADVVGTFVNDLVAAGDLG